MMYLTKFPVNMTRRETRDMLSSPYRLHAAVAGSFPSLRTATDEGRLLWRLDMDPNGQTTLWILSPEKPSLVGLDEQIGWPDLSPQWKTREYDALLNHVQDGQIYAFRLVANPVRSVVGEDGKKRRIPHVTVEQQVTWLMNRANTLGFEVVSDAKGFPQVVVSNAKDVTFKKRSSGVRVALMTVQYDGVLRVRDADAMRRTLVSGVGHGKGFGCGLLTLSPHARG